MRVFHYILSLFFLEWLFSHNHVPAYSFWLLLFNGYGKLPRWLCFSAGHVRTVCHSLTNTTSLPFLFCIPTDHSKNTCIVLKDETTEASFTPNVMQGEKELRITFSKIITVIKAFYQDANQFYLKNINKKNTGVDTLFKNFLFSLIYLI